MLGMGRSKRWDRIPILSMKTDLTTEGTANTEGKGTTNQTNLTNQEKRIGLVGPMSNHATTPQWVENAPWKDLGETGGNAQAVEWAATDWDGSGISEAVGLDRTREIARECGARVFDFVWVDDSAAARNASLVPLG